MSQPEKKRSIIADSITVGELAETLNLPVTQLVGELFKNGIVAINERIDFETATIIVGELGLDVELQRKQVDTTAVQRLHIVGTSCRSTTNRRSNGPRRPWKNLIA